MTETTAQTPSDQNGEPVLAHINPADLLTHTNVRADLRLDAAFVASITERGVITPITAYRREGDGAPVVLYGHRRAAAAKQAGLTTIPVYLVANPQAADRLIDQMGENEHRAALSTGERVRVFAALADLGMSRAAIAKATATRRTDVKAALIAASNPLAILTSERYEHLTLEQAAVLSEFDTDEETITALAIAARTGKFEHAAQVARDKRAEAAARRDVKEAITSAKLRLIEAPDSYSGRCRPLHVLLDADGVEITPEAHERCPGDAAYVRQEYRYIDAATATPGGHTGEEDGDDLDEDQSDAAPSDAPAGGSAPRRQVLTFAIGYACTDFAAHGHTDRYATKPARLLVEQMSPTEHAAFTAQNKAKQTNTKAWLSATTVRRTWLATFATRRTPPADGPRFTAATIAAGEGLLTRAASHGHALAHELLGAKRVPGRYVEQVLVDERTTPARASHIALILALSAHEEDTHKHSWQDVNPSTAAYLTFLAAAKYPLADIERTAAGLPTEPEAAQDTGEQGTTAA